MTRRRSSGASLRGSRSERTPPSGTPDGWRSPSSRTRRLLNCGKSISELLFDLGWRDREDPYHAPSPESPTLDAVHLLAGALRANGRLKGVNAAVAALARAVIRA